jgi:spermidine/putrescine transport system ATP-binding protein
VAIARALLTSPAVLVLDEPLVFLDGAVRRALMLQLKRINEELGVTVLHATRDLDEALALGRRVAVLVAGRLHQVTRLEGPHLRPADATVARWIAGRNVFPAVVKSIEEAAGTVTVTCGAADLVGTLHGTRPGAGTAVLAGLRPQEAYLLAEGAEPPAETNVLDATVESVLSYGGTDTAVLDVKEMRATIEVAVAHTTGAGPVRGASVRLALPIAHLWVVPRE